jgi:hypothetical protein
MYFNPLEELKLKRQTIPSVGKNVGKLKKKKKKCGEAATPLPFWQECKMTQSLWK